MMDQPKNLLNVSQAERQQFIDSFDYVLTDCDGTVWDLVGPFEGASVAVEKLKKFGKRVVYVSNNATRTEELYDEKFKKCNFNANSKDDLIHPGSSIVDYLRSIDFKGPIDVLGTKVLRDYISKNGFDVVQEDPLLPIEESLMGLFNYCSAPKQISALVIDMPINLSFTHIFRAQMILANQPECKFIVGATDTILPLAIPMLGPGAFIKLLEETTQRKADVVLGKPGMGLRDIIIAKYNITDSKRILFVGDMSEQDVGFGKASGFQTMAVLYNRTEEELLSITKPEEISDYWLPRFADLTTVLSDLKISQ